MADGAKLAEAAARIAALQAELAEQVEKVRQAGLECICSLQTQGIG